MNLIIDTVQPIVPAGSILISKYNGFGVLAENIPGTGTIGPSLLYPSVTSDGSTYDPIYDGQQLRYEFTTLPSVISGPGTITSAIYNEDGSVDITVSDDCVINGKFSLYRDGALDDTNLDFNFTIGDGSVTIIPNKITQSQSLASGTLTQQNNLTPDPITQAQSLTLPGLNQHHILTADSFLQGQTIGVTSLTPHNSLTPDAINQSQLLDLSALVTAGTLAPDSISQAQVVDVSALTQHHQIAVDSLLQSVTLDSSVLMQHYVITPDAIDQAQGLSVTSINISNSLQPDEVLQGQDLAISIITQHHQIVPDKITQAQSLTTTAIDNGLTPDIVQTIGGEVTIVRFLKGSQEINRVLTQIGKLS